MMVTHLTTNGALYIHPEDGRITDRNIFLCFVDRESR
jgi:hypothetical protein